MHYSKSIMKALLGNRFFPEAEVSKLRRHFHLSISEELDFFTVILFFFVFKEGRFRANEFLQFFSGTPKVTNLKKRKELFWDAVQNSLEKLSRVKVKNVPFLSFLRTKNLFRCTLSREAKNLKTFLIAEVRTEDFMSRYIQRAGIPTAFLGLYMFMMGSLGKTEIDLNYLAEQKLVRDFRGKCDVWKSKTICRKLVRWVSFKRAFVKNEDTFRDFSKGVLHIKPYVSRKSGFEYLQDVHPEVIQRYEEKKHRLERTLWKDVPFWQRRSIEKIDERVYSFLFSKDELKSHIDFLNAAQIDVRFKGKRLRENFYMQFESSTLHHLIEFECPVSNISRSNWKNITFGEETPAAVIDIENIRIMYMLTQLRKRKIDLDKLPPNALFERIPKEKRLFMIEVALESMLKYPTDPAQRRQSFRYKLKKYTCIRASKHDINSFFYFVTERCFQTSKGSRNYISNDDFTRKSILMYFGTIQKLSRFIPMIVTPEALIVPTDAQQSVLRALAESYGHVFGDIRRPSFRVTTNTGETLHFKFGNQKKLKASQQY